MSLGGEVFTQKTVESFPALLFARSLAVCTVYSFALFMAGLVVLIYLNGFDFITGWAIACVVFAVCAGFLQVASLPKIIWREKGVEIRHGFLNKAKIIPAEEIMRVRIGHGVFPVGWAALLSRELYVIAFTSVEMKETRVSARCLDLNGREWSAGEEEITDIVKASKLPALMAKWGLASVREEGKGSLSEEVTFTR